MLFCISLSYDGSSFCGWQVQPQSPSVQQCLEEALSRLCGTAVAVTGAGRTDTGVHAVNYIAHFALEGSLPFPQPDFCYKLNAILPRSVVVHSVLPVPDDFHARFSARRRSYTYFIHRQKDPFLEAWSWRCGFPGLDFSAMNRAAQHLLGTHDFSCFEKTGGANKTSLCTVYEAYWTPYTPSHVQVLGYGAPLPEGIVSETCGHPRLVSANSEGYGAKLEEGVVSETCGHPRPHKREGPAAAGSGRGRSEAKAVSDTIPSGNEAPYWYFRITADRFLRNMVRATVGTLIEVGRGKHPEEWVAELIASGTRSDAGESVPGHALFLNRVVY